MTIRRNHEFHLTFPALAALAAIASTTCFAEGAIIEYSNRLLWQANAGAIDFSENFDSFTVDAPFRIANGPLTLNGFSIVETGTVTSVDNLVDVPPLVSTTADVNGTPFASVVTDFGRTSIELRFAQSTRAFGGEFNDLKSPEVLVIDFFGTDDSLLATIDPVAIKGFIGFVATGGESLGYLRLRNTVDMGPNIVERFGLDNFEIVGIPEPTAILLAVGAFRPSAQNT